MWTMICWISNVPYLLELNNVSFWVQWNPFENMFSAMVTIHLHCSLLAFWFLTLNGFFMNSVGIPPNPNPSPPFCMPLWKLATAANSIGASLLASKMGVAQKKWEIKSARGGIRPRNFVFSLCLPRCCMQINQRRPIICLRIEGVGRGGLACCSAQKHISHYLSCF